MLRRNATSEPVALFSVGVAFWMDYISDKASEAALTDRQVRHALCAKAGHKMPSFGVKDTANTPPCQFGEQSPHAIMQVMPPRLTTGLRHFPAEVHTPFIQDVLVECVIKLPTCPVTAHFIDCPHESALEMLQSTMTAQTRP